jgi:hypothetical protein
MLTRLHQKLIIPDQETEARILASPQEREKLGDVGFIALDGWNEIGS